jgi:phosphatidylserine/phosphatidylglycerophosphate/cardiolipin synthase-like enzyme
MIVDGARVITGSPNWSENAWGNNEASLWIASATTAAAYTAEVDRVFAGASPP